MRCVIHNRPLHQNHRRSRQHNPSVSHAAPIVGDIEERFNGVSVAITCYNHERYIKQAIESALCYNERRFLSRF